MFSRAGLVQRGRWVWGDPVSCLRALGPGGDVFEESLLGKSGLQLHLDCIKFPSDACPGHR